MGISSGDGPASSVEGEPSRQPRPVSPAETPANQLVAPGHRVGPVAGILGWILVFVGFSVHGYPDQGASGEALVSWTKTMGSSRWAIWANVELLGFLLEFVFYAWLCDGLRRTKAAGWLVAVGFGAIVMWVGAIFVDTAFWTAMLNAGKRGLSPEPLSALRDIAQEPITSPPCSMGWRCLPSVGRPSKAVPCLPGWAGPDS